MLTKKAGQAAIFLAGVVWMLPLLWLVSTAFKPSDQSISLSLRFVPTLDNFKEVFAAVPFFQYFLNTILIVTGIFCIQLFTATTGAYALARMDFVGSGIVLVIIFTQIIIPNDVLILPNYGLLSDIGMVDKKLGIMLPYLGTAFGLFLLRQTFKTIPIELEEAGRIDGCNLARIIWHIYMPSSKTAYISFGLVSVSYHWNNFLWPLIVTNSVENRPLTVGMAVFAKANETGAQWATTAAATFLIILPLITVFLFFQKQFINSFVSSGIK